MEVRGKERERVRTNCIPRKPKSQSAKKEGKDDAASGSFSNQNDVRWKNRTPSSFNDQKVTHLKQSIRWYLLLSVVYEIKVCLKFEKKNCYTTCD